MFTTGTETIYALENSIIFDALEAARIGLCVIDSEGHVAMVTSEFARKTAQTVSEMLGRSARRIIGSESLTISRFAELIDVHGPELATPATYIFENKVSILLVQGRTVKNHKFGQFRVLSILDIKDFGFSETQQAVARRELAAMSTAVVICEIKGSELPIVHVNKRFEELTGYSAAEAVGKDCRFLQGADRNQQQIEVLREAVAARKPCHVTLRNYRRDGVPFMNELFISPIFDSSGLATHFVGLQREASDRY